MNKLNAKKEFENSKKRMAGMEGLNEKLLGSLRFQDQDSSIKAQAVMTFSGLMIAASLVYLSAGQSTALYFPISKPIIVLFFIGLLSLFVAAFIALVALVMAGVFCKYFFPVFAEFFSASPAGNFYA